MAYVSHGTVKSQDIPARHSPAGIMEPVYQQRFPDKNCPDQGWGTNLRRYPAVSGKNQASISTYTWFWKPEIIPGITGSRAAQKVAGIAGSRIHKMAQL